MRKNTRQTFEAWIAGRAVEPSRAIWTDGTVIYSYGTPLLAKLDAETVVLNVTTYSATTTAHQGGLRLALAGGWPVFTGWTPRVVEVDNVERGAVSPILVRNGLWADGRIQLSDGMREHAADGGNPGRVALFQWPEARDATYRAMEATGTFPFDL